jgi:hypothetical protein
VQLGTTVWDASIVLAKYLEKVGSLGLSTALGMGMPSHAGMALCNLLSSINTELPLGYGNATSGAAESEQPPVMCSSKQRALGKVCACRVNMCMPKHPCFLEGRCASAQRARMGQVKVGVTLAVVPPACPQNARKGELSRAKLHGKRAIELGSGMGLGRWASVQDVV